VENPPIVPLFLAPFPLLLLLLLLSGAETARYTIVRG